ncbi:MAG: alpha-amylase family glycosyl hydrolase [Bacteroidia bacterium]
MAVIIDIVPNHTAEDMTAGRTFSTGCDRQIYHYRTNRSYRGVRQRGKFENRPMVQRWLIDQCRHWIEEFGIDGFRIDLAGQVDRQTLLKLREELGPDIIIYGEPWIGSNDPEFENNPSWDWYKHNSPICFFQMMREIKGPTLQLVEKERDQGWASGNYREFESKTGAFASFPEDKRPLWHLPMDIHDNWRLPTAGTEGLGWQNGCG